MEKSKKTIAKPGNAAPKPEKKVKFSIGKKIALMTSISVIALIVMLALGGLNLRQAAIDLHHIVNEDFSKLIDDDILPLINDDMLPLINEKVVALHELQQSISLILEADRDVHQAVIAEKMALVAANEEELTNADNTNAENIQQAQDRVWRAAAYFTTEDAQQLFSRFQDTYATWKSKSREVIALASTPGKEQAARQISDSGDTVRAFDTMRDILDKMGEAQQLAITQTSDYIAGKSQVINERKDKVEKHKQESVAQANNAEKHTKAMNATFIVIGLMVTVTAICLAFFVSRSITIPLRKTAAMLKDIAQGHGDLTQRLNIKSKDELGQLAQDFNLFVEKIQRIISEVARGTESLSHSSNDLSENSSTMANSMNDVSGKSNTVASAAEQLVTTMKTMSTSTEEITTNIKTVASAIEQMTASITEVAGNAEKAAMIAEEATQVTQKSNSNISQLDSAADEIGKVVEVIQDIAEQTNLLALNATIEAARAGDAGKGFAVVATEVKELAKQTAEATEDITKRINMIQNQTATTVSAITEIGSVIHKVNEVSRTIAAAVEEQSIATREIAKNVSQTATASENVFYNVDQSALATSEITQNISDVNNSVQTSVVGANNTKKASEQLTSLANTLKSLVGQFKI